MSTKIYNGYKINRKMSAYSLFNLLNRMSKDFQKICNKLYYEKISKFASLCLDATLVFGEEKTADIILDKYKYNPGEYSDSLFFYIEDLIKRDSQSNEILYSNFDLKCEVKLLPIKDKTLFLLYTQHKEYKELLSTYDEAGIEKPSAKYPQITLYYYFNNCERPEHITEEDWDLRKEEWNMALKNNEKGFIYSLVDIPLIYDNKVLIKEINALYDYRISRIARIKIEDKFNKENNEIIQAGDISEYCAKKNEYLRSDRYKNDMERELSELRNIIPKSYTTDDLRNIQIKRIEDRNEK